MKQSITYFLFLLFIGSLTAQSTKLPPLLLDKTKNTLKEGIVLHDAGKYTEAVIKFQEVLKDEPDNDYALFELANTLVAQESYQLAFEYAEKVQKRNIEAYLNAQMLMGNVFDKTGNSKEAIKFYDKAIDFKPDYYLVYFNKALSQMNLKEFDAAEKTFIKTLTLESIHPRSHFYLGYLNDRKGHKTKALLAYMNFLMLDNQPNSQQSKKAREYINENLSFKVKKDTKKNFVIELSADSTQNEMSAMDLYLGTVKTLAEMKALPSDTTDQNPKLSVLIDRNNEFIKSLNEQLKERKGNTNFYWQFYAAFYIDLVGKGYLEPLTTMINFQEKKKDEDLLSWIKEKENTKKMIDLTRMIEDYKRL